MADLTTRFTAAIALLRGQASKYKAAAGQVDKLTSELAVARTQLTTEQASARTQLTTEQDKVEELESRLADVVSIVEVLAADYACPEPADDESVQGGHGVQPKA